MRMKPGKDSGVSWIEGARPRSMDVGREAVASQIFTSSVKLFKAQDDYFNQFVKMS